MPAALTLTELRLRLFLTGNVADPETWMDLTDRSPEAQAFVLLLQAAWKAWKDESVAKSNFHLNVALWLKILTPALAEAGLKSKTVRRRGSTGSASRVTLPLRLRASRLHQFACSKSCKTCMSSLFRGRKSS